MRMNEHEHWHPKIQSNDCAEFASDLSRQSNEPTDLRRDYNRNPSSTYIFYHDYIMSGIVNQDRQ